MGPQEKEQKGPQERQERTQDVKRQGPQEEGIQKGLPQRGMGQEEEVARYKTREEVEHQAKEMEEEVAPREGQEIQGQTHEEGKLIVIRHQLKFATGDLDELKTNSCTLFNNYHFI